MRMSQGPWKAIAEMQTVDLHISRIEGRDGAR